MNSEICSCQPACIQRGTFRYIRYPKGSRFSCLSPFYPVSISGAQRKAEKKWANLGDLCDWWIK